MSAGHADELLALTAFLTRESRGVLIAASIESPRARISKRDARPTICAAGR